MLVFEHISKSFPGVKALDDVSFKVKAGTVHGLLGENGAGKSTLIKILGGDCQADKASCFYLKGQLCEFKSTRDAIANGIVIVHQELQLVSGLSIAENLMLGRMPTKLGFINYFELYRLVQAKLDHIGLEIKAQTRISDLSSGQRQLVELVKAIMFDADLIALDEPSSSLSNQESKLLFRLVKQLRDAGKSIIYISHRLGEIFDLCDCATILRDGKVAAHVETLVGLSEHSLVKHMVGRDITDIWGYRPRELGAEPTGLKVQDIIISRNMPHKLAPEPISFNVKAGEILGFSGLVGAGRSELMRGIYGADKIQSGQIFIDNKPCVFTHPKNAIKAGMVLLGEDRKACGIIVGQSVMDNIALSVRRYFSKWWIYHNKEKQLADGFIESLGIKTPHRNQDIVHLSGGNQQKVLLARALACPYIKIMIIDEPTRGIDVGTKADIYQVLYSLAEQGIAIIVISSELPEIMGICDRIMVMCQGQVSATFLRKDFNEADILAAALP